MIDTVQSINIEDMEEEFSEDLWEQLPNNGGNVISVYKDSKFGKYIVGLGFVFTKSWEWLVIFR